MNNATAPAANYTRSESDMNTNHTPADVKAFWQHTTAIAPGTTVTWTRRGVDGNSIVRTGTVERIDGGNAYVIDTGTAATVYLGIDQLSPAEPRTGHIAPGDHVEWTYRVAGHAVRGTVVHISDGMATIELDSGFLRPGTMTVPAADLVRD